MKKLFLPSKWDTKSDILKFKPIKGNLTGVALVSEKKKQKNLGKKNSNNNVGTVTKSNKLSLATIPPAASKIKTGRIEKKKKASPNKKKKLKLTPAAAKAAFSAAFDTDLGESSFRQKPSASSSTLQAKFKEELVGGRFRYINEQLYTMDSMEAKKLFEDDPDSFEAYHAGYRHQVEKWPTNPLNRIIRMIKKLPISLEIGDFGCGEGQLARSVPHKVHSMDLVSCRDDIVACDMASTQLASHSLDVAVYCLSLMGINLNEYMLEANRVLKIDGLLFIAEIQSRFDNVHTFVKALESCGFELIKKDASVKLFYFFKFKKVRDVGRVIILQPLSLKPCLYRKR